MSCCGGPGWACSPVVNCAPVKARRRCGWRDRGPAQAPARIDVVADDDERGMQERTGGPPSLMPDRRGECRPQPGRIHRLHPLERRGANPERVCSLRQPVGDHLVLRTLDLSREDEPSGDVLPQDEPGRPAAPLLDPGDDAGGLIRKRDAKPIR